MTVAVTSQGRNLTNRVDPRFGRARCFSVVDTQTSQFVTHDNAQHLNAVQGAQVQAAQSIVNLGVDALMTGNVGPKALAPLQGGEVRTYADAAGSVSVAVERLKAGQRGCAGKPDV